MYADPTRLGSVAALPLYHQKQTSRTLFDHLVGERDHLWRDFKAERLGGLEVDTRSNLVGVSKSALMRRHDKL